MKLIINHTSMEPIYEQIMTQIMVRWMQNTGIMTVQETTKVRVSVTSNRTGCLFMRFVEMFLF